MARPAANSLSSIADLERRLSQTRDELNTLQKKRQGLQKELDAVDSRIAALAGAGRRGGRKAGMRMSGRGGGRGENSLMSMIDATLRESGKPMTVGEIMQAVTERGYHSSSDNFRGIINQTLIKDRNRFESVARGTYAIKADGSTKEAKAKKDR